MPPPSWAYPYATVWEDFDAATGVLSTSTSGGTWNQNSIGDIYCGLAGGGRTGVGGVGPDLTVNRSCEPGILIPGAGSHAAYMKFEAYAADSSAAFDMFLCDSVTTAQAPCHLFDFFVQPSFAGATYQNTIDFIDFDEYDLPSPPAWWDSAWHSFEFRLLDSTVTLLMDDVVLGTHALLNPGVSPFYAGLRIDYSTTFGGLVYLDHFEAGPLVVSGLSELMSDVLGLTDDVSPDLTIVSPPSLRHAVAASGLSFESPRPI